MRKSWLFPGDNDEPYVSQRRARISRRARSGGGGQSGW